MDIEEQLRSALKRESPPPGFTQRVMAEVERRAPSRGDRRPRAAAAPRSNWRAAAAAIMLTVIVSAWSARQIERRREGERARDEVMLALHIAGAKVHYAQAQVHEIGSKTVKESR